MAFRCGEKNPVFAFIIIFSSHSSMLFCFQCCCWIIHKINEFKTIFLSLFFFSKYINEDENTDAEQTKFQHTQSSTIYFLCVRYVFWFSVIGLQSHELECLALNLKSWFLFFSLVIIIIILICFISEHPPYLFWNERRGNNNKKH